MIINNVRKIRIILKIKFIDLGVFASFFQKLRLRKHHIFFKLFFVFKKCDFIFLKFFKIKNT